MNFSIVRVLFCNQFTVDIQVPTITNCPGPVSAILPQGSTTTTATWSEPIVSDNQEGVNKNSFYRSGISQFSAGVTVVTYTAIDQAGNQASCMFTVTVSCKYNVLASHTVLC